jgi:hypothetical protein
MSAAYTQSRSLLNSKIIASGPSEHGKNGEGGRTERLCVLARGATLWQSYPSVCAVNSPPGGASSCQHTPALAGRFW